MLGTHPEDSELYFQLGFSHAELGQYPQALKAFAALLERAPGHPGGLAAASQLHFKEGNLDQAARLATRLIARNSTHPKVGAALYIKGYVLAKKGLLNRARQALERAVEVDDSHAEAHNALGNLHTMQGKLQPAARAYEAAILNAPDFITARYGLGMCYLRQGAFDRAVFQFQRTLELNPKFARAHLALGQTYEKQGKLDLARRSYGTFVDLGEKGDRRVAEIKEHLEQLAVGRGE